MAKKFKKLSEVANKEASKSVSLQISSSKEKILTHNQKRFNELIARTENLQKEIETESERIDLLMALWNKRVAPLFQVAYDAEFKLLQTVSESALKYKYGKRQKELIGEYITSSLDDLFDRSPNEPSEDALNLYKTWSDMSYEEKMAEEEENMQDMLGLMFEQVFGQKLDKEDFNISPEELKQKIKEKLDSQFDFDENINPRFKEQAERKKTKKEREREEQQRAAEELQSKNLRSIYVALAKVLHPDATGDTEDAAEREELMKKVSKAYEDKDLSTLLRLEMEWVHRQSDHLDSLADDKLAVYIKVLQEQCDELAAKIYELRNHPRTTPIRGMLRVKDATAKKHISNDASKLENQIVMCKQSIQYVENASKTALFNFVELNYEPQDDFDDMFHF